MTIHDNYDKLVGAEREFVDRVAQSFYEQEIFGEHKFPRGDEMESLVEHLSTFIVHYRIQPKARKLNQPGVNLLTHAIIRQWEKYLDPAEQEAIRAMNRTDKYKGLDATHDFMDFNECLLAAWEKVTGQELSLDHEPSNELLDKAYRAAIQQEFRYDKI